MGLEIVHELVDAVRYVVGEMNSTLVTSTTLVSEVSLPGSKRVKAI